MQEDVSFTELHKQAYFQQIVRKSAVWMVVDNIVNR